MTILVNQRTRILVQGISGREGAFHAEQMMAYGSAVVGGVAPGHGGEWAINGKVPVFDTVQNACEITEPNATVIFVPARFAADAILEAVEAKIPLIVTITEGIPILDMTRVKAFMADKPSRLIGPNSPGVISPGKSKAGIIPGNIAIPGGVGVVSRSGTLTYEVLNALRYRRMGVSTCVGIGGDPVSGSSFIDILRLFEEDPYTKSVVMIGEIGGSAEEAAAEFVTQSMTKPVVAYIAGQTAPPGKRMGHAGAIIEGNQGNAETKVQSLIRAGVAVAKFIEDVPDLLP